jgi:hypothetical protein
MANRIGGLRAAAPQRKDVARRRWILSGALSGLAGGFVMLTVVALSAAVEGMGWLQPLEAIGATLSGAEASGGAATVAIGAALHTVVSAVFGVGLAAVLSDDFPRGSAATVGGAYGLFTAGVMMSLIVPVVNPVFRSAVQPVGGSWAIGHAAFGVTAGLALTLRRRASSRAQNDVATVARTAEPG